jgi:4-alpha-glucanotransferase
VNRPRDYAPLLDTLSRAQWQRIGLRRRSGVACALFSLYSSQSVGIGDFSDLRLLTDWCRKTRMSIIQLLPLNDVGFNFRPYDAQSTFALDPMYLSLDGLLAVDPSPFKPQIQKIREEFPLGQKRVDYRVKTAKLGLLWKIFNSRTNPQDPSFDRFMETNKFWLEDYALFKIIKETHYERTWEGWSEDLKHRKEETLCSFGETYALNILFQKWLQWQLCEQLKSAKQYALGQGVCLMGDLPFLVSRDSADVWAHQDYFKLGFAAGAPPDMLYSLGQRWGMPPYNWENISRHRYDYVIEKIKYAQNFYDLYRIDHVVGIFRVWTIPLSEPLEHAGLNGTFDPKEEDLWEEHGRSILSVMIKNSSMLACAEDLGVVPACSNKVLEQLGVPGIDIQRWMREWGKSYDFKDPDAYRKNSLATLATHDMSGLSAWWEFEAGTVDEELLKRKCREKNIAYETVVKDLFDKERSHYGRLRWKKDISLTQAEDFADLYKDSFDEKEKFLAFLGSSAKTEEAYAPSFVKKALERAGESASIFSVQLIHDWLSLDGLAEGPLWESRINFPGTLSDKNWTLMLPLPLEDMLELPVNDVIRGINEKSERT